MKTWIWMFIGALFLKPKAGNSPAVLQWAREHTNCGTPIQGCTRQHGQVWEALDEWGKSGTRDDTVQFHLCKILEKTEVQGQIADLPGEKWKRGLAAKGRERIWRSMEMFCVLMVGVVTGLCKPVKAHWTVPWKCVGFAIYKLYLNKENGYH